MTLQRGGRGFITLTNAWNITLEWCVPNDFLPAKSPAVAKQTSKPKKKFLFEQNLDFLITLWTPSKWILWASLTAPSLCSHELAGARKKLWACRKHGWCDTGYCSLLTEKAPVHPLVKVYLPATQLLLVPDTQHSSRRQWVVMQHTRVGVHGEAN